MFAEVETSNTDTAIQIADEQLTLDELSQNVIGVGGPDSGRSQLIYKAAQAAIDQKESALILDLNGELSDQLYKPKRGLYKLKRGDSLIGARDKRSQPWSPLAEIKCEADCDRIARAIVERGDVRDSKWNKKRIDSIVIYLSACFLACYRMSKQGQNVTNKTLDGFLSDFSDDESDRLLPWVGINHPVAWVLDGTLDDTAAKVDGKNLSKLFMSVSEDAGFDSYSLNDYANSDQQAPLFVVADNDAGYAGRELATILTSVYLDAIGELPDSDNRHWLLINQLGLFPAIPSLSGRITHGAEKGLAVVASLESTDQIVWTYGQDKADALLSCFETNVRFEPNTSEDFTAEKFSRTYWS